MRHASRWHLYRNFLFLVPLFAIVLIYQIGDIEAAVRNAQAGARGPVPPFVTKGHLVTEVDKNAMAAGLHKGDRILAVNGANFTGERVEFQQLVDTKPGQFLVVAVAPHGGTPAHAVAIALRYTVLQPDNFWWGLVLAVLHLMLLACVLIGIYVAAVLPYDSRALIVFALLVSTPQFIALGPWWEMARPLWTLTSLFRSACLATWPLWLVLFALHFPHRFSWAVRRPVLEWLILAPLFIFAASQSAHDVGAYFAFDAIPHVPSIDWRIVLALSISVFFFFLFTKIGANTYPDSTRRLRLLVAGASLGLVPCGAFVAYESLVPHDFFSQGSVALILFICVLFLAFPLTLAYVVVADRAMNVRVALRQGVRYAVVKGGARFIGAALVGVVMMKVANVVFGSHMDKNIQIIVFVAAAIAASRILARLRSRLLMSVDRRFFREAYNTEKVLEELIETVQLLARENDLLQTVTRRISQTLHVPRVAVLLQGDGMYRPVCCLGFDAEQGTAFAEDSKTVELMKTSRDPARVYFDRKDSWVHDVPETELLTLKSIGAQLLLPVGSRQKLLGILSLGPKRSEEPYSATDIHLLKSVLAQTGLAIENSRLMTAMADEVAQRERINREMEIAREVQERLFPQRMPVLAGIEYSGACRPALGVGGDYYDFLQLANGELGIAIGDVSGKGIAAALLMASLQASLRGQAMVNQGNLACLMANVNQLVYDATPINRYATFFYGQYNRESRVFTYVNAGHNPPFVLRRTPDGSIHVIRLEAGGPVIGLFPNAPYQQGTLILEPGDIFVGYTDGISEAMNSAEEEWGEERLIPSVAANGDRPAADLIPCIMEEADQFVAGAPQHDDMTLVVMKMSYAA